MIHYPSLLSTWYAFHLTGDNDVHNVHQAGTIEDVKAKAEQLVKEMGGN